MIPLTEVELTYTVDPTSGCWNCDRGLTAGGYGKIRVDGKPEYAHRFSFEQSYGPIPPKHQVHHVCKNRRCINPEHLQAHTPKAHGRAHSFLTQEIADEIRQMAQTTPYAEVAERYGVQPKYVYRIATGLYWSDVPRVQEKRKFLSDLVPPDVDEKIVLLRFSKSQRAIAQELGITRACVRRTLVKYGFARP